MMHYGSWITPQQVMDNRYYSSSFVEEPYRSRSDPRDEDSEQTADETHETITTATSEDRSPSADIFRLEFAATQRLKLVSNAEGLFNRLVASNILPHNEQDQIEQWLCMKQEYEECITSDETASTPGYGENTRRSLERIEEVTETDDKTDESNPQRISSDTSMSDVDDEEEDDDDDDDNEDENDEEDEDDESDINSENPDFLEKLDECMNKLKQETDFIIDNINDEYIDKSLPIIAGHLSTNNNNNNINNNNNNNINNSSDDNYKIIKPIPIRNKSVRRNSMLPGSDMCNDIVAFTTGLKLATCYQDQSAGECVTDNSPDILVDALKSNDILEPIKTLKTLTINNQVKQNQVKIIKEELDDAHKRIEELQKTIKIKEEFIGDMIKNSETRRQKVERKKFKVKRELSTRSWTTDKSMSSLRDEKCHRDIELCKNIAIHYEQRLMDIERIRQIAGDSAKKVLELEMSLNSSKMQMEKLQWQLKNEEDRKNQLENELAEDQKKIKELEEKYNLTESKLQELKSESEDERANSRMRNEQKVLINSRLSQLEYFKDKSLDSEKTADLKKATDNNGVQKLRDAIEELRIHKDSYETQKSDLTTKIQEGKLTEDEARKQLECCNETIEMIDTLIEQKNSLICELMKLGVNSINRISTEKIMIDRHLSRLSNREMRELFYVYFKKVIDLKESSRTLDIQNATYEADLQKMKRQIRTLVNALKDRQYDHNQTIVMSGRDQEKLQLVLRDCADETYEWELLERLRRENKSLRRKIGELKTARITGLSPSKYTKQGYRELNPMEEKTKVTREKNRIIIQKTHCDKKKK